MFYCVCYCKYDDSTFIDKCYFSTDGKKILVSELAFVKLRDAGNLLPIFGIYNIGKNEPNGIIAVSEDSIYFYDKLHQISDFPTIDSVIDKKTFLRNYSLTQEGINITNTIKINISERFLREENTINLFYPDKITDTTFRAPNTLFWDYFIEFVYNDKVIFKDTLLNSYADKKHLYDGINEIVKKKIFSKDDNQFIGTMGYGTRIYSNVERTIFFIRAKYDISSYVRTTSEGYTLQIEPSTKKEVMVKTKSSVGYIEKKELRILLKTSR